MSHRLQLTCLFGHLTKKNFLLPQDKPMALNARLSALVMASLLGSEAARLAAAQPQGTSQTPPPIALPPPPGPVELPQAQGIIGATPPTAMEEEAPVVAPHWALGDARQLLAVILSIGKRGLLPADYEPAALKAAIDGGEGADLDALATRLFTDLATDLRDGRTPLSARGDWFINDTDAKTLPLDIALQVGLESHDIDGALTRLEPKHPDYAALKAELAKTPATSTTKIARLRANLDRWRWLPQSLGVKHVLANIPEYMVRINTYGRNIAAYRVIVGKLDTPTPQISAPAVGIVVHPPWVLPQSIIKQEVGPLIARDPAKARARGYVWTGEGKTLSVVQKPGPTAALGQLKLDMPNPHAIFLHDTPNKALFANNPRAYSHGCLRTERAFEFGILLSLLQSGQRLDDADARNKIADNLVELIRAGDTARAPFKEPIPVYIGYFTIATAGTGPLQSFPDLYSWDAPVIAAFAKARKDLNAPPVALAPAVSPAG
jgi:murein L,D-transpeptidase YcbB/YkuD